MCWDNFVQYGYTFHVHYCQLEGLDITSDLARDVLLYVFYGEYTDKSKEYPVMRCLHYKTIQGRHRFGKYVQNHFAKFIEACNEHPEWSVFFDDLGKGDAPIEYLVLVEQGLRSFGSDIHAMGSRAMESQERWFVVAVWRKREAYIACIRFIRGHTTYPQWDCYKLEDYSERQALNTTFLARHFPLSNGTDNRLNDHVDDPRCWSTSARTEKTTTVKRVKKEPQVKPYAAAAIAAATARPQIWDVEKGCFVPF